MANLMVHVGTLHPMSKNRQIWLDATSFSSIVLLNPILLQVIMRACIWMLVDACECEQVTLFIAPTILNFIRLWKELIFTYIFGSLNGNPTDTCNRFHPKLQHCLAALFLALALLGAFICTCALLTCVEIKQITARANQQKDIELWTCGSLLIRSYYELLVTKHVLTSNELLASYLVKKTDKRILQAENV